MKKLRLFSILAVIAVILVTASFALAEPPKVQKPFIPIEKQLTPSKTQCVISNVTFNPSTGLKVNTYVSLGLEYRCDGTGTVGPLDIEVQDGAGKLGAAKRDVFLESGTHSLSIPIWQWQTYAYSKIVVIIKYRGEEVYKRISTPVSSEWFISDTPGVLVNKPITK